MRKSKTMKNKFFTFGKNPFRILVVSLKLKKTGILSKQ